MKREFAEQYGRLEQWHWWFRGRQRIIERVLRRELAGHQSHSIISLGCGPAEGLAWLLPFALSGGRLVGLDLEFDHRGFVHPGLQYVVGALEAAPFSSNSFDLVLALDVLEHLDDDVAGLREAARLVKPSGLILVTVPALPSLWGRQDEVSHHKRRYTKRSLCQTFERAGLVSPQVMYFNTLLLVPIAAIRWARRATWDSSQSRSDFDDSKPGWINEFLAALFAAERHLVGRVPLPAGVSLAATARR